MLRQLVMWMFTLGMVRFRGGVVLLHRVIGPAVVLIVVNLFARFVLLMIDLRALLRRELAPISRTIIVDLVADVRFSVFKVPGLMRSQLPRLHPVRDARLLVPFACVDPAHCRRRRLTMILGREIATICARQMLVRSLHGRRSNMRLVAG